MSVAEHIDPNLPPSVEELAQELNQMITIDQAAEKISWLTDHQIRHQVRACKKNGLLECGGVWRPPGVRKVMINWPRYVVWLRKGGTV